MNGCPILCRLQPPFLSSSTFSAYSTMSNYGSSVVPMSLYPWSFWTRLYLPVYLCHNPILSLNISWYRYSCSPCVVCSSCYVLFICAHVLLSLAYLGHAVPICFPWPFWAMLYLSVFSCDDPILSLGISWYRYCCSPSVLYSSCYVFSI